MNYFAHFFIDEQPDNDYHNLGLILPDITRGYVKTFRNELAYNYTEHHHLKNGCLKHYHADKKFHASSFFKEITEYCLFQVNRAPFSVHLNRKWFLAHVLAEVLLDRILVRQFPEKLELFYEALDAIDDEILTQFLELHASANTTHFLEFFNHFRKVRYIYYYPDNNKFVYSLNRIMIKAGIGAMSESDQEILKQVSLELEMHLLKKNDLIAALIHSVHEN